MSEIDKLIQQNRELSDQIDKLTDALVGLKEANQQLRDEIAILKKLNPKPKIPASNLEGQKRKREKGEPKTSRGKHPRKKKTSLEIHREVILKPDFIPEGAVFKGYKPYTVQDILLQSHNTRYRIGRWRLPDGSYVSGKLPSNVQGHYGTKLVSYILHQYFVCRVTEPLLLEQLKATGVLISAGQLSNILIHCKEPFHQEKEDLLAAGILASNQVQADDTGGRHRGKSQYTTIIGNEWFSLYATTESKSRVNFLRLLQNGQHRYLINDDTIAYLNTVNAPNLTHYLNLSCGEEFEDFSSWEAFLASRNITKKNEIRFATEAALFASLIEHGIPRDLGVHADNAGQFDCFIRSLCWVHEERHYRKLILPTEQGRADLSRVRGQIWAFYQKLKKYQHSPDASLVSSLRKEFDATFQQKTTSPTLNKRLSQTYKNKEALLRVLERPNTPLHNNSSETDARSAVIKRKVSGGTRSDAGRDARDTFLSLKQTCRKLGIHFFSFLKDRLEGKFEIPRLSEVIRQRTEAAMPPI